MLTFLQYVNLTTYFTYFPTTNQKPLATMVMCHRFKYTCKRSSTHYIWATWLVGRLKLTSHLHCTNIDCYFHVQCHTRTNRLPVFLFVQYAL